jgi:hypothetical protein
MEPVDFVVTNNDGDFAFLLATDDSDKVTVARTSCVVPCSQEEFVIDLPVGATVKGIPSYVQEPAPGEN